MTAISATLTRLAASTICIALAACSPQSDGGQKEGASEPREMTGEEVYAHWCADCHDPGPGHPGTLRLEARGDGKAALLERDIDPETLRYIVRNGIQMMPPFRETEISDEELARLTQFMVEEQ